MNVGSLRAAPVRAFSSDYRFEAGGQPVTELDLRTLRDRGEFVVDGQAYSVRRAGILARSYFLERGGATVCEAKRTRFLPPRYRLQFDGRTIELAAHIPRRKFAVWENGLQIGTIAPERFISRTAIADFGVDVPVPMQVFLVTICVLEWRRRARRQA